MRGLQVRVLSGVFNSHNVKIVATMLQLAIISMEVLWQENVESVEI